MAFLLNHWWLVLIVVISGGLLFLPYLGKGLGNVVELSVSEAVRLGNQRNSLFLDIRESKDFSGKKIPKALHIPLSELDARSNELKRYQKRPVIFYDEKGLPATKASAQLQSLGFTEVFKLRGGLVSWLEAGLPVVHQPNQE